jgi:predicted DNA binding CopG/RHH family protein
LKRGIGKMNKRDYGKEYEKDKERDTRITIRIHKEEGEKFKNKLEKDGLQMSEFLKKCIENYINE